MLLSQALSSVSAKSSGTPAIRYLGKDLSYRDLSSHIARLSYLFQRELGTGARVGMIGSNSPAWVASFFALSNTRSCFFPIDPASDNEALISQLLEVRPTHLLITADHLARIKDLLRVRSIPIPVIDIERKTGGEFANSFVPAPEKAPLERDPILLLSTAGTSGRIRFCLFSHAQILAATMGLKRLYHPKKTDRVMSLLNWAHPFSLVHGLLFPLLTGGTVVIDSGAEPNAMAAFLLNAKATRLIGTPEQVRHLFQLFAQQGNRPATLQSVVTSLSTPDSELPQLVSGYTGIRLAYCYGQTENLWSVAMSDLDEEPGIKTNPAVFRALAGLQYKVLYENGDEVSGKGPREGQLAVSGATVMLKYFGSPENENQTKKATQNAIRGTWLYTGDLFQIEGSGEELSLQFMERKDGFKPAKRVVENYDPAVVEAEVSKCPGLLDVAVFRHGAKTLAAVVKSELCPFSDHEILEQARLGLSGKNTLDQVVSVPAIARLPDGSADPVPLIQIFETGSTQDPR